jgi:hypothetical protein
MHFLQANSDLSVRIVCNKTGGTIKGDIKKSQLTNEQVNKLHFLHFCAKAVGSLSKLVKS